jgi:hypothetical protein
MCRPMSRMLAKGSSNAGDPNGLRNRSPATKQFVTISSGDFTGMKVCVVILRQNISINRQIPYQSVMPWPATRCGMDGGPSVPDAPARTLN